MSTTSSNTSPDTTARVGRPRDASLDMAIQAAVVALLEERGYNGLSIKAVAERAGTTTPAIYRRWGSKSELVLSAVFRTEGDDVVADSGDLEADLRTMIRWTLEKLGRPVGRAALAGLLGEPVGSEAALREQMGGLWSRVGARLQQATERGEVRSDLDLEALIGALAGPATMAAMWHGERAVTADRVDALTSLALHGIRAEGARPPARRRSERRTR